MRVAILSDIHANLPALETVLADIERVGVEQRWCLGDVVGYGAHPNECAELMRSACEVCLVGNHDLAVLKQLPISAFSTLAAVAATWTTQHASAETLDFLRGLEPYDIDHEAALYHASPRDPVWEYVLAVDQAAECMAVQQRRVSLVGHSHVALFFTGPDGDDDPSGDEASGSQAPDDTELDISEHRWLINPGSVGQPRDGDPRAAWLELDTEAWTARFHRCEYDIDRAAEAITAAGLPEELGERLYTGR